MLTQEDEIALNEFLETTGVLDAWIPKQRGRSAWILSGRSA